MKGIDSKMNIRSGLWFTPALLIFSAFFAIAVLSPTIVMAGQEKGQKKCSDGIDNDEDGDIDAADTDCGGGDDGTDAPNAYNLARTSFIDFGGYSGNGNGGISADGQDSCTVPRPGAGGDVVYDYWAWQESLLSDTESIHDQNTGAGCFTHDNRSDVSGGGRWFLITTAGPEPLFTVQRWLVFDFSESTDGSPCPNLDGDGSGGSWQDTGPIYRDVDLDPLNDPCVDHLTVRFPAKAILKNNTTTQALDISIRYQPEGSQYWPPWGAVQYIDSLYVRAPSDDGPFAYRDCTVMSTRPAWNLPHDKMEAEFYFWVGPSASEFIGTYNMPLEVCVIRASD